MTTASTTDAATPKPRTVMAVFRFVVDHDVTDAQIDAALTPAWASLDGDAVIDHDGSGNERTIPIYELTLNTVAGSNPT